MTDDILPEDILVVFCTCGDENEANRIAATLVERHLAACVRWTIPGTNS